MPHEPARALAISVVLVALFAFFFVYPSHDPKPNDLPIAVAGIEQGQIGPAVLEREGFEVEEVQSEREARELIEDREVYGALLPGKVLVAGAASFTVAEVITEIGTTTGRKVVVDVKPLDEDDPRGTTLNQTLLPLTITAILGAMLLFTLAPGLPAPRRLGMLAAFAVLGSLAALLIVRVAIGALPGSFIAITAIAALGMFAVATVSSALMLVLGPPGIMASFLVFLMLGNPASGAATAPELLPTPWAEGGPFLPPGALATGIRNTSYFDGAGAALWLTVLAVWAVIGVVGLLRAPKSENHSR